MITVHSQVTTEPDPTALDDSSSPIITGLVIQTEQELAESLRHLDPATSPSIFTVVVPRASAGGKDANTCHG